MSRILRKIAPIGEARDREVLRSASALVYEEHDGEPLAAHVFSPEGEYSRPAPVVVFFHGGFWDAAMPAQFVPHCLHFAARGAVAVAAETRVTSKHGTGPAEAVEDARELVRWLRRNADELGIDPQRVVVGGAAGGAFLALHTAMPKIKELPPAVDGVDCRPQALVLFSSLLETGRGGMHSDRFPDARMAKRMSPARLVRRKLPPMVLFHGKADRVTPHADALSFRRRMRWRGNACELLDYDREDHMFFNFNVNHRYFELTVRAADAFLVRHGLLDAEENPDGNAM